MTSTFSLSIASLISVSYTDLDVYKSQAGHTQKIRASPFV